MLIFCKIWDERKEDREDGDPYAFQIIAEDTQEQTNAALLKRLKDIYAEGRKQAPEVFKDDIRLSAAKVRTVVSYLEDVNLTETDLDSKGRAFETFMTSFFRGNFGQFFTPRAVVKFIVDVLPITSRWRVLDTSCGSGGFLLHALDKVRKAAEMKYGAGTPSCYRSWHEFAEKRLFGIEINEQIARTAKMNMIIHDDGHTNVVEKWELVERLAEIDKRRKAELAKLETLFVGMDVECKCETSFARVALSQKEKKANPEYKAAADRIAADAEKAIAELRDKLDSEYKLAAAESFPDEDIFMAIAEDIGFDAAGKPTKVNELDEIGVALAKFIKAESGVDA